MNQQTPPVLIGHGYDIHRLETRRGGKLVLAGVTVSDQIAPIAHSDGDVVLHAITDALLGAAGLGDIGLLFGDDDPRWQGADSSVFVRDVVARVQRLGYLVSNVDVTLLLERPKVSTFRKAMLAKLIALLGTETRVNLKAATNEGVDSIGRGEAVAAHAVVLLATAR
jgi:2-C-methyl-D-erythritol 2,4-cyclodiphosphate synthase